MLFEKQLPPPTTAKKKASLLEELTKEVFPDTNFVLPESKPKARNKQKIQESILEQKAVVPKRKALTTTKGKVFLLFIFFKNYVCFPFSEEFGPKSSRESNFFVCKIQTVFPFLTLSRIRERDSTKRSRAFYN